MTAIKKILRLLGKTALQFLQSAGSRILGETGPIALVPSDLSAADRNDFLRRMAFYSPDTASASAFRSSLGMREIFSSRPILLYGTPLPHSWWSGLRTAVFDVDPRRNPHDGWAWCRFSKVGAPPSPDARPARERLRARIASLQAQGLSKCYIFGTGESLAQAIDRDWSDGYRIVCNTIVRDETLWRHINPHFIVAGDAIYHFGFTEFARTFRADLAKRLRETDTFFVYPDLFNEVVAREFGEFANRLIPIPAGKHVDIHVDLTKNFAMPARGNVLNILLLPLACTLSKNVNLWGFDGRAPDDRLFWSNSKQHSYPELMSTLQKAHPAFFEHYLPADKPDAYVKSVHGDQLDTALCVAEEQGWHFMMMHKSWTPTLQKRFSSAG
ncbi:MAG: hypothetical protein NTY05_04215 [Rhodocyclales bacterium]|nr:hypothetical protein [Rhodocyclales bacterium]